MDKIVPAITALSALLLYFQQERHRKTPVEQDALMKFQKALHETNKYIRKNKETSSRDHEKEEELSNLWVAVAIAIKSISKDLADRCYIKGEYWRAPESWTVDNIEESRIGLDGMEKELNKLIIS